MPNIHPLAPAQAARAAALARQAAALTQAADAAAALEGGHRAARAALDGIIGTLALLEGAQLTRDQALKRIRDDVRPFLASQAPA